MGNQTLTPEEAALMAQLSGVAGQKDVAQEELDKAAALRRAPYVHAGGKWGGIAAGVANALNGIDSAISYRMGLDQKKAAYAQNSAALQQLEQYRRAQAASPPVPQPAQQPQMPQAPQAQPQTPGPWLGGYGQGGSNG